MLDLAVRGGTVVTADAVTQADVGIAGEQVVEFGAVGEARQDIKASGLFVLPGVVDVHTHIGGSTRQHPHGTADDFLSGTIAAACGGVTTVIDYARQLEGQTPLQAVLDWQQRALDKAIIDYSFHLIVADFGASLNQGVRELVEAGFPSVKAFMMLRWEQELLRLMTAARDAGALVMVHAESGAVLEHQQQVLFAAGKRGAEWYVDSRPEIGEAEATSRAIDYGDLTGADVCIVHLSCELALERVRAAKARGSHVRAEVRPCYLLLDRSCYARSDRDPLEFTGCPPLRSAENIAPLWQGLADGSLDVVASDHATWTLDQKRLGADDFSQIPQGIPALETELGSLWTVGVIGNKLSASRLVEAMATTPAKLHGLYPRKGTIAVGSDADIVLLDPNKRGTISQQRLHSRAGYEPCEGMPYQAWPVLTISRGEVIARDGEYVGTPVRGKLLRRAAPEESLIANC
ncbi:MAG TPA: dihydropyrimidinase [Chloroflexota bacterium]|nr:dihydropyrimidinase [Chloroflexota bacterium]